MKFGIRGDFVDTILEVDHLSGTTLQRAEELLKHIQEMEQKVTKMVGDIRQKEKVS